LGIDYTLLLEQDSSSSHCLVLAFAVCVLIVMFYILDCDVCRAWPDESANCQSLTPQAKSLPDSKWFDVHNQIELLCQAHEREFVSATPEQMSIGTNRQEVLLYGYMYR
jgi:hypothetical protein